MSDKESRVITVSTGGVATTRWIISIVLAATLAGITGFIMGTHMGNVDEGVRSNSGQGFGQMDGGTDGRMLGGMMGTVTEISGDRITIKNASPARDDTSGVHEETYILTSKTTVTEDGSEATFDDIQVGDMVRIEMDDDSKTATSISLGIPNGMGRPQSSGTSDDDVNASSL